MEAIYKYINNYSGWSYIYIGLVLAGFWFKYENLRFSVFDVAGKIKRIVFEVLFIAVLSFCWDNIEAIESHSVSASVFIVLTLTGYCFYNLISKFNENLGFLYPFINGYLITSLSFMGLPVNIVVSVLLIIISALVTFRWAWLQKSQFCEVLLLCVESVILAGITYTHNLYHFVDVVVICTFTETALYFLNCMLMCGLKTIFDEDPTEYLFRIKGYKE